MKTHVLVGVLLVAAALATCAATNDLSSALQRGLFEEEANHDLNAAIKAYQAVANQFDKDRKLAATAIFRLGECYRKQGDTNAATGQYQRILREFFDQTPLLELSRQSLAALGAPATLPASSAAAGGELEKLTIQLDMLKSLSKQKLRVAIQQEFPNPVLTSLMQKLAEAEQDLVRKRAEFGEKHVEVLKIAAGMETLNQRIDEQVEAVLNGLEMKRALLKQAATVVANTPSARPAGPNATEASDEVQRIRALIKDSPDLINAPDKNGETLLESAAAKGNLGVVKVLLESGAAINGIQEPGLTPLHYAAGNGHKAVVDQLLSKGAKADAATLGGVTALHLAAAKGYESVAKALLAAGASVHAPTRDSSNWSKEDLRSNMILAGQTPLHVAADAGYAGLVELLIARGAKVNAEDNAGRTALSYAAQKRSTAVLRLLLAAKANPNVGRTMLPLAQAAMLGDVASLKLLLANGADADLPSKVNTQVGGYYPGVILTPLFLAVTGHQPEVAAELLRAKANPNGLDPQQNPILFVALQDAPTLRAILEGGANPDAPNRRGVSPLCQAALDKNSAAVELLLAHHANANSRVEGDWTALHAAVSKGSREIAELLLKHGVEVNVKNKNDETPLHLAVQNWSPELVELLLANQADPNARDKAGMTPLDLAKRYPSFGVAAPAPGFPPGPPIASYPPVVPSVPGTPTPPAPTPVTGLTELLRRHGALEDLPHMDRIEVTRRSVNYAESVFAKGTNDYNHFTLLELIAAHYGLVSTHPGLGPALRSFNQGLFFPDLARVVIRRPTPDGRGRKSISVDVDAIFKSAECSRDVSLQWGDGVEIPEADHPINSTWQGLAPAALDLLSNCLQRRVEITVKGQTTNILLRLFNLNESQYQPLLMQSGGRETIPQFSLLPVLNNSGMLRASSDLSRVKLSRVDAASGQRYALVLDCRASRPPDLWLRDGDKIEVPERGDRPTAAVEPLPSPSTALRQGPGDQRRSIPVRTLRLPSGTGNPLAGPPAGP